MRTVSYLILGLAVLVLASCNSPVPVPAARITEFSLASDSHPRGIVTGADGNLWFTQWLSNQVGRISPSGTITEFVVPTPESRPHSITAGPDGNLWFTEDLGDNIGRITPEGVFTEFPLPSAF